MTAALEKVVHGANGTARRIARLPIAGKTGTAQVIRLQEGVDVDELAPNLRHHAWFVGWAPLDEPNLAVAAIVEHGGDGGASAAPVVARVVEAYLERSAAEQNEYQSPLPERTPDIPRPADSTG